MLTIESPPGRWLRLSHAARQLGITRDILLAEVNAGRLNCRLRSLGARGLVHVASADVAQASLLLNGTPTASKGAAQ